MENANGVGTSWTTHNFSNLNGAFDIAVGDLDGDGWLDVVCSGYLADAITFSLNGGTGLWGSGNVVTAVNGPRGIDLGDVDRDGDLDVVRVGWIRGLDHHGPLSRRERRHRRPTDEAGGPACPIRVL